MLLRPMLLTVLLLGAALAGCASEPTAPADSAPSTTTPATPTSDYQAMGFDGTTWPRLDGVSLTILDHGAFGAFDDAKKAFENLTGATVVHVAADDAGSALQRAVMEKGSPTFDILYGIDNVLWTKAIAEGVFSPYTPLLSTRIDPTYVFFDAAAGAWPATPVDHGYIGLNVDLTHASLAAANITTLADVAAHASTFVTEDPRTSTPGLGFLLATIATYPEGSDHDWKAYWRTLFSNGVLVTSGWSEAYEQHFSGGYGADYGGLADKAIVTSYTTSPAYEHYYERPAEKLAQVVVAPQSTFHQIETMGIVKGTKNLAAAQAWIEFTLTDAFQHLVAPNMAVYPVVQNVSVEGTFGGIDPQPGTFVPAAISTADIGANIERWVREWVDLCEANNCA